MKNEKRTDPEDFGCIRASLLLIVIAPLFYVGLISLFG